MHSLTRYLPESPSILQLKMHELRRKESKITCRSLSRSLRTKICVWNRAGFTAMLVLMVATAELLLLLILLGS